ncbi:lipoate--protein ligase family protein [Candidatus Marinamargulisbacteria bacterium SCGC AG-439-L15]|nr:lipoate--protein ligase family protein [Candidatus Marinamargulisbacteria bacterium SCGC AG-439-L15]
MQILDKSFDTPLENIRTDETLLKEAESSPAPPTLRFWESSTYFVVLGSGNKAHEEAHEPLCEKESIPILKRCSGGGTVLQGPGCMNYALILPFSYHPDLKGIKTSNSYIMQKNADAFSTCLNTTVEVKGYTDLAINNIKFSGNAQRRLKSHLLFHGTILYNFDLSKIETYLKSPPRQPEYRQNRSHLDFVRNIAVSQKDIKDTLIKAWQQ